MNLNQKWVPMKWPCGPLEIERLKDNENGNSESRKTAERWADPSTMQFLKGSPINCLVVDWASGSPVDQAQQRALMPLIKAGRQLGLSFVGTVLAKANLTTTIESGRAAGLQAVILEKLPEADLALPVIVPFPNDEMDWSRVTGIYRATGSIWPGADLQTNSENSAALGGPTGIPGLNSNGWFSLLSREVAPGKIPWIDLDPPPSSKIVPAEQYCRVIADSRVYGSRWLVSLDPWMRKAVLDSEQTAMGTWARITRELAFFESHAGWEVYEPQGVLAIVSDFAGLNAISSGEVLNFLNRSQTQFLAVDRLRMKLTPESNLKGIVWMDSAEPTATQHDQLLEFVRQGGLLIASKYWGPAGLTPLQEDWISEYSFYNVGKGRIAVANDGLLDSYQLARYAHLLIGRRNDFTRLFNPEMTNCHSSLHPDGHKQIIHLVNYGSNPVEFLSLWVNAKAKSATLVTPESESDLPLECFVSGAGTEFHLPKLSVNCTVEIERSA